MASASSLRTGMCCNQALDGSVSKARAEASLLVRYTRDETSSSIKPLIDHPLSTKCEAR